MGGKSPKPTSKRISPKQLKSSQTRQSKQVAPDMRRMIPPKK
jgi:hypothetical protein